MKKILTAFFVSLILFSACKARLHENYGTVVIDLGGSSQTRAIGANGLPDLKTSTMTIRVDKTDGTQIEKKDFAANDSKDMSLILPVGEVIKITVRVQNLSGIWQGDAEHTVTEGENRVSVTLKKAAAGLKPLTFSLKAGDTSSTFTLKLGEQKVFDGEVDAGYHNGLPPFCRDNRGRIYLGFQNKDGKRWHLYRYTSAGTQEMPKDLQRTEIRALTADRETGTVYALIQEGNELFLNTIDEDLNFNRFSHELDFSTSPMPIIAADGGKVFILGKKTSTIGEFGLFAYTVNGTQLEFKTELAGNNLEGDLKIPSPDENRSLMYTDLLMYEGSCYLLQKKYRNPAETHGEDTYYCSNGALISWNYDKKEQVLSNKKEYGISAGEPGENNLKPIGENDFAGPVAFVGFDGDTLYIADDGVTFEEKNELPRITANVNRRAAFDTKKSALTFEAAGDGVTWAAEKPVWKEPNGKTLVWKKAPPGGTTEEGMVYYFDTNTDTWLSGTLQNGYSDVFCFDQDGNFYVVRENGTSYAIEAYELQADDGSYPTTCWGSKNIPDTPTAIAVDISGRIKNGDGKPVGALYCSHYNEIKRYIWKLGGNFSSAEEDPSFTVTLLSGEEVTALAANKDGLFVAVKTKKSNDHTYSIKVRKCNNVNGREVSSVPISEGKTEEFNQDTPPKPIWTVNEILNALYIKDGVLYGLAAVRYQNNYKDGCYTKESISGKLVKIGTSTANFTDELQVLHSSEPHREEGGKFAPYRFIAVMPKKLVVASDGFWGIINAGAGAATQFNFIWSFGIKDDGTLDGEPSNVETDIEFSKKLTQTGLGCGFEWN